MKRDYDGELNELAKRLNEAEGPVLASGLSAHREVFGRLTSLYLMYRYLVERGLANEAPKGVRILYAKLANCLIGTIRLLQAGHPGPAAMLVRSLFETAVHLQVILQGNVEERSKLFENYLFIERDFSLDESFATEQQRAEQAAGLQKVRADYHPDKPFSWCWKLVPSQRKRNGVASNPTFKELCSHIGHPEYYDLIYDSLSAAIHPVPRYETWLRRNDGSMELGSHFGPQVPTVAKLSLSLAGDSLIRIIDFLTPEDVDDLRYAVAIIMGYDPTQSTA